MMNALRCAVIEGATSVAAIISPGETFACTLSAIRCKVARMAMFSPIMAP